MCIYVYVEVEIYVELDLHWHLPNFLKHQYVTPRFCRQSHLNFFNNVLSDNMAISFLIYNHRGTNKLEGYHLHYWENKWFLSE